MSAMNKLIAGNWKMNGSLAANEALLVALAEGLKTDTLTNCDIAICVPTLYLPQIQALRSAHAALSQVASGAQDVSSREAGAYTGEISAAMLKEMGCRFAIVGHSERRLYHGETDALVAEKAKAVLAVGMRQA